MPQVETANALPPEDHDEGGDEEGAEEGLEAEPRRKGTPPSLVPTVPSYRNHKADVHDGVLYITDGPECPVTGQRARRVLLDAIGQAEWDATMRAWGEPEEEVKSISVAEEESLEQTGSRMFDDALLKTESETNGPWRKAVNRNWTSW